MGSPDPVTQPNPDAGEKGRPVLFDVYNTRIPRAEGAQPTAYGSRIMPFVEELLPLVIGRPKAIAAVIPAGDRAIGSGSKCNAIGHLRAFVSSALKREPTEGATTTQ